MDTYEPDRNEVSAKACREKYWGELTDSEKIDRLRGVIKAFQGEFSRLQKIVRELTEHKHNEREKVICEKDICYYAGVCEDLGTRIDNSNEVYF